MTNPEQENWYLISNADELDSPALVFYPDRIAENIVRLKNSINDISRLRPHVKTHKNPEISAMMIGAGISKFKCATIAEAEMLAICKAADVLLAYQPVGPKISRFIELIKTYPDTHFSCLCDNAVSLKAIASAALAAGLVLDLFLDLNVGMNRTGIAPDEKAVLLYQQIHAEPGVNARGLHAYDGHIHDASLETRKEKWQLVMDAVLWLEGQLIAAALPKPVIVAGGTPTYPLYAALEEIECSPGTFILWDKGYQDAFTEQEYLTAALVLTRVISLHGPAALTVDLGHKSVAAENNLQHRVYFLNAPDAAMVGQSEEHLVLDAGAGHGFAIGDILYGLPIHICPTVALYGTAAVVENRQLKGEWKIIARERKINI
ncbi:D-TA family PLP-dependent enzyme [Pedobacter sp. MC2016-15]|uniref:D-TA family PLP-dependent enzyme n=1 Tax=Pedobacter sp. MC2016-15 TaxID=2994473 RepID=UPI0022450AAD|nr:D-TA family PLP-dependent enzyme [Pedobacter sp. MC2016-15]MCX2479094.1 D-TA family PLP-dependent enzyme [Pedobacter sp. MC2016-15]